MEIINIKAVYHRNGVAGTAFFAISFTSDNTKFIATAEVSVNDREFNKQSFRVVNPVDISDCQQGDVWADEFQKLFAKSRPYYIYDWLIKQIPLTKTKN